MEQKTPAAPACFAVAEQIYDLTEAPSRIATIADDQTFVAEFDLYIAETDRRLALIEDFASRCTADEFHAVFLMAFAAGEIDQASRSMEEAWAAS